MATGSELAALCRLRDDCTDHFTRLSKRLDKIEQPVCPQKSELIQIKNPLQRHDTEFHAIQDKIIVIDEGEIANGLEIADEYAKIELRAIKQFNKIRLATPSKSTNSESAVGRESASLKIPEIRRHHLHQIALATPAISKESNNTSNPFQGRTNTLNQDNAKDHTPPTENIVSNQEPIPSHDIWSSSRDTHNMSPTRDLTIATFTSSAS
jgi:hypothetical protein